ncbi:MAG: BamA/TamA family outer membrane protein, partial [Anaerolineales bacterium]
QILYLPFRLIYSGVKPIIAFAEKTEVSARILDFFSSDDRKRAAYPTYYSRTGGGIKFYQKDLVTPGSKLSMTATIGLHWQQLYKVQFRQLDLGKNFTAGFTAQYRFLSDGNFFGLGNDSLIADESNFALKQTSFVAGLGMDLSEKAYLGTTFTLDLNEISKGRDQRTPSTTWLPIEHQRLLPGLNEPIDLWNLNLQFQYNSPNRLGNPSAGWELFLNSGLSRQINGNKFGFIKTAVDITRYIHLFYDRTLVVRLAAESTRPFSNTRIPFYYLSQLGPHGTIRGFHRGRFRDRDMTLFSLEYRYPLIKRPGDKVNIDAMLFVDWGKVSHNLFQSHLLKDYHRGIGLGIRIFSLKGVIMKLYFGKSKGDYRIYLSLNE